LRQFNDFMNTGPGLVMWLLTLAIVAPIATLFHELGHAIAARSRLEGPVRIRVGGDPPFWQFAVAGLHVRVRPIFMPFGVTGACEFDASALRAADAVVVSLAGPAASLLGAVVSAIAFGWTAQGTFLHAILWQSAVLQGLSVVLCIVPFTLTDGGGVHRTDGWVALDAIRRSRRPRAARPPARVPASREHAPVSVASPACATCNHPRSEHIDLVTGARGSCRGQDFDFQTLAATVCTCPGYVHAY
jgi:hypothetical protein